MLAVTLEREWPMDRAESRRATICPEEPADALFSPASGERVLTGYDRPSKPSWRAVCLSGHGGTGQDREGVTPVTETTRQDVLLIDDHRLFADGLTMVLETLDIFGEITAVTNGAAGLEHLQTVARKPGLIITDFFIPGSSAEQLIPALRASCPDARIVCVSGTHSTADQQLAVSSGADIFVHKHQEVETLVDRIEALMRGETPEAGPALQSIDDAMGLTSRQMDVIALILDGKSNKEIARDLDISPETVKIHVRDLMQKSGVANRTQLSKWAMQNGLTVPI